MEHLPPASTTEVFPGCANHQFNFLGGLSDWIFSSFAIEYCTAVRRFSYDGTADPGAVEYTWCDPILSWKWNENLHGRYLIYYPVTRYSGGPAFAPGKPATISDDHSWSDDVYAKSSFGGQENATDSGIIISSGKKTGLSLFWRHIKLYL